MTIYVCKSEDAGAPVLDGQVGSLVALLDAVLVNGYGSHPGLGWTIEFSDTDRRVYRMPTVGTSGRCLRVDDTYGNYAKVNAYDDMTDIDTGVGGFPGTGINRYWRKSSTTDATARQWAIFSDGAFLHVFLRWHPGGSYSYTYQVFGDIAPQLGLSFQPTIFSASGSASEGSPSTQDICILGTTTPDRYDTFSFPSGDGSLSYENFKSFGNALCGTYIGNGSTVSPTTSSAEFHGSPITIAPGYNLYSESPSKMRNRYIAGTLPGLLSPWTDTYSFSNGTTYDDLTGGDGKTWMLQRLQFSSGSGLGSIGSVLIDITGPWR